MANNILRFKGTWRNYQKRVLLRSDQYLKNGKIHIVAAPGSGKTTLGIELIGRIGKPALILAPSIAIREQWIQRIKDGFLNENVNPEDYISNKLKEPKWITVATYQALHSAMTGSKDETADEKEEEAEVLVEKETEDYVGFELLEAMKKAGIGILCLDECHHLRSEWWKALEKFHDAFKDAKIISLTATPPYDDTPAMWKRYMDLCGEIDEEITVPELVKEGSLCPHQDYVMFNYPTKEEKAEIAKFKKNSEKMIAELMNDDELCQIIQSHPCLFGTADTDTLLENPAYLSSILIYLQARKIAVPKQLLRLLGAKELPPMEGKWMEHLLQGLLYEDTDSFACDKVFCEQLTARLKAAGLIEKRKVCFTVTTAMEKLLITSKGKIESIKKIVASEYQNMGTNLRMLVLTDYIRKECVKNLGNPEADMNQLGVLPFFENIRREEKGVRLGILCGALVVIPSEAKEELQTLVGTEELTFGQAGNLSEEDYVLVKTTKPAVLIAAVTELFSRGWIQILIGTKSLLGEGWDAPCVNSLILASFVGSYMLSNQMRGRAIRIDKNHPEKTSNIWHLVCIDPDQPIENNIDYNMLLRRMDHYMGLHYTEDSIESGIARLSAIDFRLTKSAVEATNRRMLALSEKRQQLKERWQSAMEVVNKMEIADEVEIADRLITMGVFFDAIQYLMFLVFIHLLLFLGYSIGFLPVSGLIGKIILAGLAVSIISLIVKCLVFRNPLKSLKVFGKGVRAAMIEKGMISSPKCRVETEAYAGIMHGVYLKGGTGKEKADFANCVVNFFAEPDNQRYLLVSQKRRKKPDGYFVVPDAFSKNKEDAQLFTDCMKSFIGKYELVYTRNTEGRQILLEARMHAFSAKEERAMQRKKVKSALE